MSHGQKLQDRIADHVRRDGACDHLTDASSLRARAERRSRQQLAVAAIGSWALEGLTAADLLGDCVNAMRTTLGVPFADAGQIDERPVDDGVAAGPLASLGNYTAHAGEPVLVSDADLETRFEPTDLHARRHRSALSVPVSDSEGRLWCMLGAGSRHPGYFDESDLSFVSALANILGSRLQHEAITEQLFVTGRDDRSAPADAGSGQLGDPTDLCEQVSHSRLTQGMRMGRDLQHALQRGELHVAYQPIVGIGDGTIRHVEALLRWRHPVHGAISPADFIPVAEQSGLICPIGEWVLDQVARQLRRWDSADDPRLHGICAAVNFSGRQLIEPDLHRTVIDVLATHGVPASRVGCEITETALIDDPALARANVAALADAGLPISLDDFCTGYSALAHLRSFPLTGIKLDRTFVARIATEPMDRAIVRGLVELAGAIGLTTVAEGVEDHAQLEILGELGCGLAQGFLFAPALAPEQLEQLVCTPASTLERRPPRSSG